jgi:hypothetical protein
MTPMVGLLLLVTAPVENPRETVWPLLGVAEVRFAYPVSYENVFGGRTSGGWWFPSGNQVTISCRRFEANTWLTTDPMGAVRPLGSSTTAFDLRGRRAFSWPVSRRANIATKSFVFRSGNYDYTLSVNVGGRKKSRYTDSDLNKAYSRVLKGWRWK